MVFVPAMLQQVPCNAHAKLDTPTLALVQQWFAQVGIATKKRLSFLKNPPSDSCHVNNGGCNSNATCAHEATTNAVKCVCKAGFTNTGSGSTVICTGKTDAVSYNQYCTSHKSTLDSCQVNNGGCDRNAVCSRDAKTNVIECLCKTGYTNTGLGATVVCTGNI